MSESPTFNQRAECHQANGADTAIRADGLATPATMPQRPRGSLQGPRDILNFAPMLPRPTSVE